MENFLLYKNAAGEVRLEVLLQDETVWLTQKAMGKLFGVESHTITYHLKEIFKSGELNNSGSISPRTSGLASLFLNISEQKPGISS